jgi:hypothetical protein
MRFPVKPGMTHRVVCCLLKPNKAKIKLYGRIPQVRLNADTVIAGKPFRKSGGQPNPMHLNPGLSFVKKILCTY